MSNRNADTKNKDYLQNRRTDDEHNNNKNCLCRFRDCGKLLASLSA